MQVQIKRKMEYVMLISDEVYFRIGNINIGIETLHKDKLISDIVDLKKHTTELLKTKSYIL